MKVAQSEYDSGSFWEYDRYSEITTQLWDLFQRHNDQWYVVSKENPG